MDLSTRYTINASPTDVWTQIRDIGVVADCLPGAELISVTPDGQCEGKIHFKLGPKLVTFSGTATFTPDDRDHAGLLQARGVDGSSRSRAKADVTFRVMECDQAAVSEVDVTVTMIFQGPLTAFAESGGVHVGKQLLEEFAQNLSRRLDKNQPKGANSEPVSGAAPARIRLWRTMSAATCGLWRRLLNRSRGRT